MKFIITALSLAIAVTPVACQTIASVVNSSEIHTTLLTAVQAASPEILQALSNPEAALTLFAPDDTAFATLPEGTVELLTTTYLPHLDCVLYGHVYGGGAVSADTIRNTTDGVVVESLTPGYDLEIFPVSDDVVVNRYTLTVEDIDAGASVVHSISGGVLLPDCVTKDIATLLNETGTFSTLLSLVDSVDLTSVLTAANLKGLTLFAPNDDAFGRLSDDLVAYLTNANNTEVLVDILTHHVYPANIVPTTDTTLTSLSNDTLAVTVDGTTIMVGMSTVKSTILASNGIIHELDTVLVPDSADVPEEEPPTSGAVLSWSVFAVVLLGSFLFI